jgi:uncharacterized protein (TIGR02996 family)
MMDNKQGFLRMICETPYEDAPRLVYADWLEESGYQDRADFIRVQCALDSPDTRVDRRANLLDREWSLWMEHQDEWEEPLGEWVYGEVGFIRGFAEVVEISATNFIKHGAELFAYAPTIRIVHIVDCSDVCRLASSPHLRNLTTLFLCDREIEEAGMQALAASPHLRYLTELHLCSDYIGNAGATALAASPYLRNLATLDLQFNEIDDAGARALASSPRAIALQAA